VNAKVAALLNNVPADQLRAVAAGIRLFTWKRTVADSVGAIPCSEGIEIVARLARRRRTEISEADARRLLEAGNDGIALAEIAGGEPILTEPPGGWLIGIAGSPIAYGAIRMGGKLRVYLKRQQVPTELFRITEHFAASKPEPVSDEAIGSLGTELHCRLP
jgi:hypothetical protein